jgi:hypothetical protein
MILSVLCFGVALQASATPDQENQENRKRRNTPTYKELLETTYLGHAGEMPETDEPVEVLLAYLEQGKHPSPSKSDVAAAYQEVANWKKLVHRYPSSRYARFGLGRAYRSRAVLMKSTKDLRSAAKALAWANSIALSRGRILYTREISEIAGELRDPDLLEESFAPVLAVGNNLKRREYFLALLDYADGLAELSDSRAWDHFEQALDLYPEIRIEGVNRYGDRLLKGGKAQEALNMLESRLTRDERVRYGKPALLRKQALVALGMDTSSADDEIEEAFQRRRSAAGLVGQAAASNTSGVKLIWGEFAHSTASDDCRSTTYAQQLQCASSGSCYYPFEVNLAEILWNEARGESLGGKDMVGWTVRDRALERVSCDAYPGGTTSTTCRSTVPCGDPSNCAVSQYYCCSEHGGTTTVGATHFQFNDAHVTLSNLESAGLLDEAYFIILGAIPEPSNNFVPSGVSSCTLGCGGFCNTGTNYTSASPQGPMEYRANNYCAAAQTCKWYAKNVCGDLPTPSSCSTGGNSGDNHFWNRLN